nr:hypothetical protein [Lachnospiraceae bacterium]
TISIKGYLLENHPDMFRFGKDRVTIIKKDNPDYVVYSDHAYVFTDNEKYPRRDNIDVLRDLFGYDFIEAVEHLEAWAEKHNIIKTESEAPDQESEELDLMFIPDHIDDFIDDSFE